MLYCPLSFIQFTFRTPQNCYNIRFLIVWLQSENCHYYTQKNPFLWTACSVFPLLNHCVTMASLTSTLSYPAPPLYPYLSTCVFQIWHSTLTPWIDTFSQNPLNSGPFLLGLSLHTCCSPDLLLLLSIRKQQVFPSVLNTPVFPGFSLVRLFLSGRPLLWFSSWFLPSTFYFFSTPGIFGHWLKVDNELCFSPCWRLYKPSTSWHLTVRKCLMDYYFFFWITHRLQTTSKDINLQLLIAVKALKGYCAQFGLNNSIGLLKSCRRFRQKL